MKASRHAVRAVFVMTMAVAGCGGSSRPSHDGSAMVSIDATADHAGADGGSNQPDSDGGALDARGALCFGPADCPTGQTCCLVFDNSGAVGIVSCQASCVPDDTTTWIACTTGTDCPPARPACAQIASVNGRPFNICEPAPPAMR